MESRYNYFEMCLKPPDLYSAVSATPGGRFIAFFSTNPETPSCGLSENQVTGGEFSES